MLFWKTLFKLVPDKTVGFFPRYISNEWRPSLLCLLKYLLWILEKITSNAEDQRKREDWDLQEFRPSKIAVYFKVSCNSFVCTLQVHFCCKAQMTCGQMVRCHSQTFLFPQNLNRFFFNLKWLVAMIKSWIDFCISFQTEAARLSSAALLSLSNDDVNEMLDRFNVKSGSLSEAVCPHERKLFHPLN